MTAPGSPSERLTALGLELPPVAAPVAAYVPSVRVGDQVWTSGQLPLVAGRLEVTGVVGTGEHAVAPDVAAGLARTAVLNALAAVADTAGDLDRVRRVLKVVGYVASEPGFGGQPAVVNGASELLGEVFGPAGAHVRSAVGVAALPLGAEVEIDMVLALPD